MREPRRALFWVGARLYLRQKALVLDPTIAYATRVIGRVFETRPKPAISCGIMVAFIAPCQPAQRQDTPSPPLPRPLPPRCYSRGDAKGCIAGYGAAWVGVPGAGCVVSAPRKPLLLAPGKGGR